MMKPPPSTEIHPHSGSNYISRRAGWEFWLLTIATFLCNLPRSMFAMLSVILANQNTPSERIGLILTSPILPTLVCLLISGVLVATYGTRMVILIGIGIMLISYSSIEFTIHSNLGVMISLVCFGIGYGIFMPAAVIYAKSRLGKRRLVYLFGIFSSMFPLPNAIGPALAEAYLEQFGLSLLFAFSTLPLLICLMIAISLSEERKPTADSGTSASYLQLLKSPRLRIPFIGVFVVGLIFGLIPSFLALILTQNNIPVSYFFTSFTLTMFLSRFTLMRYAQALPREIVFMGGLGFSSISYLGISLDPPAMIVLLMGILFGIGHSAAYPTLSVWCSDQFLPQDRGRPVALFNTLFFCGIYLTPLIGGMIIDNFGSQVLSAFLAFVGLSLAGSILIGLLKKRKFH